jgi:ATP-binding protein involved in chromosome partitioning
MNLNYEKQKKKLEKRLSRVKNIIAVMSGKGGVGKSTVTTNIAISLAERGFKVGIFDSDFHGPSIPKILGVDKNLISTKNNSLIPPLGPLNIKVMSIDFLLPNKTAPVIWRGPMKGNVIRQLLGDTEWNNLDYLLIDLPPGTGDEPLSIMQLIPFIKGIILVTHPSELSEVIVNKSGNMAKQLKIPMLGVVENMSLFKCPDCGNIFYPFGKGAGEKISDYLEVPLLAKIPIELEISRFADRGESVLIFNKNSEIREKFYNLTEKLIKIINKKK